MHVFMQPFMYAGCTYKLAPVAIPSSFVLSAALITPAADVVALDKSLVVTDVTCPKVLTTTLSITLIPLFVASTFIAVCVGCT